MQRLEVSGAVRPIYGSLGVKRLTCTDCAFQPIPFRNYDLMPPERWEGSFWVHRAGLGPATSVWVGRILDQWPRCVSLITNPVIPFSGTNLVNEPHLNTTTSQLKSAFLKLHSEKPWSSVRCVRVCRREFRWQRNLSCLLSQTPRWFCGDRREEFSWAPNLTLHSRKAVHK